MKLVIAEKPSVAMNLSAVLGAKSHRDRYVEGNGYLVSWCYGHLAELSDPAAYHEAYEKWRLEDLPILPDRFQFTLRPDRKEQFDALCSLMGREDVTEVINACDAGREGELIFRTVYALAGCTKPILRLWISSMEDAAIREGFDSLWPGSEFDGLHQSALCRAEADWLVGINATRYFSLLYGTTLRVGRVMSPTLAMLVQREAEIAAFVPEPFYTVQLDCGFPAVTERMKDRAEAEKTAAECTGTAVVQAVEQKQRTEKPPLLYDLTTLQRDANRIQGYTAQQTLDYLQALYEKKLCTYPRTDSRYLTNDMAARVPEYVAAAASICDTDTPAEINASQVCDSGKVSDHHAVIPTISAGSAEVEALPLGERVILNLLARRLLAAVSEPYRYLETKASLNCGGHLFSAKGKTVLSPGWKTYSPEQQEKDAALPELTEGQAVPVAGAEVKEGKTSPPKHFTEGTLLSALETAGAKELPENAERKGIGTPATRAGILEKLVSSGLVDRRKSKKVANLIPTDTGTALITILPEQLQSPLLTAEWEQQLKEIEGGTLAPEDFMAEIAAMLRELIRTYQPVSNANVLFPSDAEIIGNCPLCGQGVVERKRGFFCANPACSFALWKNSKLLAAKRKTLTKNMAAVLLKEGCVPLKDCWSEKTGKTYDATLFLDADGDAARYRIEFEKRRKH